MESRKIYRIIGMMSGTSLDGIDLACSVYTFSSKWTFKLQAAKTYPYTSGVITSINKMQDPNTTFMQFKQEELKYSQYLSQKIILFIKEHSLTTIDYLSLHGHTIFHHPQEQLTVQITNLPAVAAWTGIDTIGNFRQLDVIRGGEGAPLAPFGDQLFQGDVFINFGGVANIGYKQEGWDIMYCNLFFNYFSQLILSKPFDLDGQLGRQGQYKQDLYQYLTMNWQVKNKRSLQRQKFQQLLNKLINNFKHHNHKDILTTFYYYLAQSIKLTISEIVKNIDINKNGKFKVVCTGGGTHNTFLLELIRKNITTAVDIVVPHASVIQFKEAIIFGFLGLKYLENMQNCSKGIGGVLAKGTILK